MVARLLWEQDAAGSSPVTSTKISGFDRKNSKPQGITLRFVFVVIYCNGRTEVKI